MSRFKLILIIQICFSREVFKSAMHVKLKNGSKLFSNYYQKSMKDLN